MQENIPLKTLSSKIVYENPWITVREDSFVKPNGEKGIYGVMESKDSVIIAVIDDRKRVYLIRKFSYPSQAWSWELPGGGGDDEDPIIASKRELVEETGIIAEDWKFLGKVRVCNGLMTEKTSIFVASKLKFDEKPASDDAETINGGKFFSLDEIHTMTKTGEIDDGQTLTCLYLAEQSL